MRKNKSNLKNVDALTVSDLKSHAVWQFTNADSGRSGELAIEPVEKLPVDNLDGRLAATEVCLANGQKVWATLGNVDVNNPRLTRLFLSLTVLANGKSFTLARYHDFDYDARGPVILANFLGLTTAQVFPISYDLSNLSGGDISSLTGKVEKEPSEMLTRAQTIALAVP